MSAACVLRIEALRTYFHTYEGTVKAVEGIDLKIDEGETVGLVGETGCGKSVTALSVLRLIPTPPGVIEAGRVFLDEPEEIRRARQEYDALALRRLQGSAGDVQAASQPNTVIQPASPHPGTHATASPTLAPSEGHAGRDTSSPESLSSGAARLETTAQVRELLRPEIQALEKALDAATNDKEREGIRTRLAAARCDYDILAKTEEEMRSIRGNSISMIFQEPMTALNPVFTVGAQIAETLILHRRDTLLHGVLDRIDMQRRAREGGRRGYRVEAGQAIEKLLGGRSTETLSEEERRVYESLRVRQKDELVCSLCHAPAPSLWDWCLACGTRLSRDLLGPLRPSIMRTEKRLYTRLLKDPQDQLVDFVGSVRLFRRLVRSRLEDEGVRLAVESLREVRIAEPERIAGQYPFELSGGMRQRSMIAMMMACNPRLLIADEPTTALDVTVEAQILKLMKDLQTRTRMSILLITHDLGIIAEVCDKVGVMYAGSIAEFGTTEQVFHRMMHPYTNGLMQSIPRFKGSASQERKKDLYIIKGSVPNLLHPPSGCRFHPRCPRALEVCQERVPPLEEVEPGHLVACHNPVPWEEPVL